MVYNDMQDVRLSDSTRKRLEDKIKRAMREQRGIITGLMTPPEERASRLAQARAELERLAARLKDIREGI